jgi:site-specific DNA-cytosine methylase
MKKIPEGKPKPRALDLFSGTGSVSKRLTELRYEVVSLDINRAGNPTICCSILDWKFKELPEGHFQLIAASPHAQNIPLPGPRHPEDLEGADKLVLLTLKIVEYFQPQFWWLENPRGGLLKTRSFMEGIPYVDVDYCQFTDWGYQKPTRIWGSPLCLT